MALITAEPTRRRSLSIKPLHWMMLSIVVLALSFGGWSLRGALAREVTIEDAKHINGTVLVYGYLYSTGAYDEQNRWTFDIQDKDGDVMTVVHESKPGNFEDAIGVSAIGRYNAETGIFEADSLLVKCPSKYQEQ